MPLETQTLEITELLNLWSRGKTDALDDLMERVFQELHKVAERHFYREPAGHTLQPTALVNEVFLQLHRQREIHLENRSQFLAFSAQLMRRILVDHARARLTKKRGGDVLRVPLEDVSASAEVRDVDLLALDDSLQDLAKMDPEGSRVIELRFFGGLTHEEIAEIEGISLSSVRRRWRVAKLWLYRELAGASDATQDA